MRARYAGLTAFGLTALGVLASGLPAQAATSHTERFVIVGTSTTSNVNDVSAAGPINALGKDVPINPNTMDRFEFPNGDLVVSHHRTSSTQTGNPKACIFQFTEQGTFTVVSGTKAYAKAKGHGVYTLAGVSLGCSQNKPPVAQSVIIHAAGPLSY